MSEDTQTLDRLHEYLRQLTPAARAQLLIKLEKEHLRAEDDAAIPLALAELRKVLEEASHRVERPGNPSRVFFQPLEPFLCDGLANITSRGRITRASLTSIWMWICRELLPGEAKTYNTNAKSALLGDDVVAAERLASALRKRVALVAQKMIATPRGAADVQAHLANYMGPPQMYGDLCQMLEVFDARDQLVAFGKEMPALYGELDGAPFAELKAALDRLADANRAIIPYALRIAMNHLAAPGQLLRLATRTVPGRDGDRPYPPAATLVLADIEEEGARLRKGIESGQASDAAIVRFREAVAGVQEELMRAGDAKRAAQLAALCKGFSNLLAAEAAAA